MKINRRVLQPDGSLEMQEKILAVDVKRGWRSGTKITFPKEGNQGRNKIPADVIFTVKDKEHPLFSRNGDDLLHVVKISLKQALCGCVVPVPTLHGKSFTINASKEVVTPQTRKVFKKFGLPNYKNPAHVGDLVVSFDIKFPDSVSGSLREALLNALP